MRFLGAGGWHGGNRKRQGRPLGRCVSGHHRAAADGARTRRAAGTISCNPGVHWRRGHHRRCGWTHYVVEPRSGAAGRTQLRRSRTRFAGGRPGSRIWIPTSNVLPSSGRWAMCLAEEHDRGRPGPGVRCRRHRLTCPGGVRWLSGPCDRLSGRLGGTATGAGSAISGDARSPDRSVEPEGVRETLAANGNDELPARKPAGHRPGRVQAGERRFRARSRRSRAPAGDRVLQQVAELLRKQSRDPDVECVGRLGGDEFAVLLDCDTSEGALRAADRLCAEIARFRFACHNGSFGLGACIGVVMVDQGCGTLAEFLELADQACYRAKRAGKGRAMLGQMLPSSVA